MRRIFGLVLAAVVLAGSAFAQVQITGNIQIGGSTGGGGGVQYNPSTTAYYFIGDSRMIVSSDNGGPNSGTSTALTCDGTTCTATVSNSLVGGTDWITWWWGTYSPSCLEAAMVPVTTATSSQFTFPESYTFCTGTQSGTGGEYGYATHTAVPLTGQEPFFKGHGSVELLLRQSGGDGTVAEWDADYTSIIHPHSPAVTGITPSYLYISLGFDDLFSACATVSTLEGSVTTAGSFRKLLNEAHQDGFKTVLVTESTRMAGTVYCTSTPQDMIELNQWQVTMKGSGVATSGYLDYADVVIDVATAEGQMGGQNFLDGLHYSTNGNYVFADSLNSGMAAQGSWNLGQPLSNGPNLMNGPQFISNNGTVLDFGVYPTTHFSFYNWNSLALSLSVDSAGDYGQAWIRNGSSSWIEFPNYGVVGFMDSYNNPAFGSMDRGFSSDNTIAKMIDLGNGTLHDWSGGLRLTSLLGPATAPTGSCSVTGIWQLTQDGAVTRCLSGTWTAFSGGGGFTNPMTTLGDTIYGGTAGAATRLAGNTTTTPLCLQQTGTGSASAAPVWGACGSGSMTYPGANTLAVGNSSNTGWRTPLYSDITALWTSCTSGFLAYNGTCSNPTGSGTVTTTGTPASGNLAAFSGATSITPATGGNVSTVLDCADTSGSGTAQSCSTAPSFTPVAGDVIVYSTTTANTGSGLTINVNSLGAKPVAKWQSTTTLAAGDIAAGKQVLMTYDGTNWESGTIGNAPSGGGSSTGPLFCTYGGTVNAITATCSPTTTSYYAGESVSVYVPSGDNNTSSATLNVDGLGAKSIYKVGSAVVYRDISDSSIATFIYDGTNFELQQVTSKIAISNDSSNGTWQNIVISGSGNSSTGGSYGVTAVGQGITATGEYATVFGVKASAIGNNATSIGKYAYADGNEEISIGDSAGSNDGGHPATNSVFIGTSAGADSVLIANSNTVAVGYQAGYTDANGLYGCTYCAFFGENSYAVLGAASTNMIGVGYQAQPSTNNTAVIGNASIANVYFGSTTAAATVHAAAYMGPATAPSGACTVNGAWVFSQDGHATFCASGTWTTKI